MYSDRPASEVLASAAVLAEQAKTADQTVSMSSTKKGPAVVLPSHHGLMVSSITIAGMYTKLFKWLLS